MVRAIIEGRKSQTRRVVKPQREAASFKIAVMPDGTKMPFGIDEEEAMLDYIKCPYGQPGDMLWVKEMFYAYGMWVKNGRTKSGKQKWVFIDTTAAGEYRYFDNPPAEVLPNSDRETMGWFKRNSLFMPYKACRIKLKVTDRRVERLNDTSEEDAIAEGVIGVQRAGGYGYGLSKDWDYKFPMHEPTRIMAYKRLWESINGKGSWEKNERVWVISFERL